MWSWTSVALYLAKVSHVYLDSVWIYVKSMIFPMMCFFLNDVLLFMFEIYNNIVAISKTNLWSNVFRKCTVIITVSSR